MPIGELAALGTATCWCVSSLGFEAAGKRIGSLSVNLIRIVLALCLLAVANWAARGLAWPSDASAHAWIWLSVSGLVGFTFGDLCIFRAFVVLGARRSMLLMSLAPPMAAALGWLVLGETLTALDLFGMALTASGVALVILERNAPTNGEPAKPGVSSSAGTSARRQLAWGVILGVGGALGQAGGLVLSKYGMGEYNAVAATEIRIIAGTIGFMVVCTAIGWWPRVWAARKNPSGVAFSALGAVFGPFLGVTLSLYAVQHTQTGIAASIMATTPLLIIPLSALVHKERVTVRAVAGAAVAFVGVALLFL